MEVITIKDIARICDVGVSTVSRAINNHPDINEKTKKRIMKVIEEYNYIPNNSARNLKLTETNTIAVLIKGITNTFFNQMLKIFEKEIHNNKYSFLIHRVEEEEDEVDVAISLVKEKRLKGIIFLGGFFDHSEEKLKQLNVPYVSSTGALADDLDVDSVSIVSVDNIKESYKMVDYLCKLGHKKIAIITSPPDEVNLGGLRLKGYKQALKDNGVPLEEGLIKYMEGENYDTFSMKYGYEAAKQLFKSKVEFTALYCISDSMAVGACKAIFEQGKKIPEDYSVAGFDGTDITYYYEPSITTIKQPDIEIAEKSIEILFNMIDGDEDQESVILSADLIVGASTKQLR